MTRLLWIVLRFSLCSWVGAAVLFVVTGVLQVQTPSFDAAIKNHLAVIRFPAYYIFGFTHVGVATVAVLGLLLDRSRVSLAQTPPTPCRWLSALWLQRALEPVATRHDTTDTGSVGFVPMIPALCIATRRQPAGRRALKVILGLCVAALLVMTFDYVRVYRPLEAMMLDPSGVMPSTFRGLHERSKRLNFVSLGMCLSAGLIAVGVRDSWSAPA